MALRPHPDSLLGRLASLPDPRTRAGQRYPLSLLLGLVLLGMLHGRDSLRGAWVWAEEHWGVLWRPLGGHGPHFPAYNTLRNLLAALDADQLDRHLRPWLEQFLDHPLGGISADGKLLRGSKPEDAPALHLVSLVAHECATVLAQREAEGRDELAALLALLSEVPLVGRTVTRDAGLTHATVTQLIRQQQGDYLGVVKGNHPEVRAVLDDWLAANVLSPCGLSSSAAASATGGDRPSAPLASRQPDQYS